MQMGADEEAARAFARRFAEDPGGAVGGAALAEGCGMGPLHAPSAQIKVRPSPP